MSELTVLPLVRGPHARFLCKKTGRSWIGAPILRSFGPEGLGLGGCFCGNSVLVGRCKWCHEYFRTTALAMWTRAFPR